MSNHTVGVYAGRSVVKCVAIKNGKDLPKIINNTYYIDVDIQDNKKYASQVIMIVDKFISKHKIRNPKIRIATDIDSFVFEIGNLKAKEIEKSVIYQIQEQMNIYDIKQIRHKWVYSSSEDDKHLITATAIKTNNLNDFIDNTFISSVESIDTSISRFVNKTEQVVILSMQQNNITITLFMNELPVYKNTLKVNLKDTNMISNYVLNHKFDSTNVEKPNLSDKEINESESDDDTKIVNDDILFDRKELELEPVISELSQFIRSNLFSIQLYLESKTTSTTIESIYYTYDESIYSELVMYLNKYLDIRLYPLLVCSNLIDKYKLEDIDNYFGYDIALAIADTNSNKFPLKDLVFNRKSRALENILTKLNIAMFACIIMISTVLVYYDKELDALQKQLDAKLNELSIALTNKNNELTGGNLYGPELNIEAMIDELNRYKGYNLDVLNKLQNSVLNTIELTSVTIDSKLTVEGKSANYADIGYFALKLEEIYNVTIENISTEFIDNAYNFKLIANLNRAYDDGFSVTNIFNNAQYSQYKDSSINNGGNEK